jgi:hypothetical protein
MTLTDGTLKCLNIIFYKALAPKGAFYKICLLMTVIISTK